MKQTHQQMVNIAYYAGYLKGEAGKPLVDALDGSPDLELWFRLGVAFHPVDVAAEELIKEICSPDFISALAAVFGPALAAAIEAVVKNALGQK